MGNFLKWIAISVLVLLVLLVAAAVIIPVVYEDDIEVLVQEQINENINAQVAWSDLDLSILSSFPKLTLQLKDVVVANNAPFEGVELARIGQANISMGLMSVMTDKIQIKEIGIDQPVVDVRVLEDGTANYDIALVDSTAVEEVSSEDGSSSAIDIQSYWIKEGKISYQDESSDMKLSIEGLDHKGNGDFGSDLFVLETNTTIDKLLLNFEGVDYLKDSHVALKADLDMDMKAQKFTFKENELVLDQLPLAFDGWFAIPEEGYDMDIDFAATRTDLEGILSLIPAAFAKDLAGVKMSGASQFDGFVKGHYDEETMPEFALNANVQNGRFKYPDLPSACENIQLKAVISNPQGKDLNGMVVDISQFMLEIAGQPLDARLILKNPITDPLIDAALNTKLDLAKIREVVPMEEDERLKGLVDADIVLKGAMSAIENQHYDQFHASGKALLQGMEYVSRTTGFPINIDQMELALDPKYVDMPKFEGKFGGSDLSASGRVDNYLGWYLKEEGLVGRFKVHSNRFDLDELMASNNEETETEVVSADSVEIGIFEVPEKFDVSIDATASTVHYDGIDMTDAAGVMVIKDENIAMDGVFFKLFGGDVYLNGDYNTKDRAHPFVDFDYDIRKMDIAQTAKYVGTVQKLAPIAQSALGKFSTKMNMRTEIDENMEPIFESILGNGDVNTHGVTLEKFRPMTKIASTLQIDRLSEPKISDTGFTFKFEDGKMVTQPFNVKIDQVDAVVSGYTALDQSINYDIKTKIPSKLLGGNVNGFVNNILGQANQAAGTDLALGDLIDVDIKLTGTVDEPIVKPSIAGGTQNIKDAVIDKVTNTITEEVQDLSNQALEEAQKQADKLMAEANKQAQSVRDVAAQAAQRVKDEGYAAAQRLVDEAKNPIAKAGAKIAADKLRRETDKKAQKIIDEGDRKANGVVSTAQTQADNLLEKARDKAP